MFICWWPTSLEDRPERASNEENMYSKYKIFALMASALFMSVMAAEMKMEVRMEDSTESPVADLAVIGE